MPVYCLMVCFVGENWKPIKLTICKRKLGVYKTNPSALIKINSDIGKQVNLWLNALTLAILKSVFLIINIVQCGLLCMTGEVLDHSDIDSGDCSIILAYFIVRQIWYWHFLFIFLTSHYEQQGIGHHLLNMAYYASSFVTNLLWLV